MTNALALIFTDQQKGDIVYTSEGNRLRAIENQMGEQQKLSWAMLLMGLAAGFIGMYFIVARPMAREMRAMKIELTQMQEQMVHLGAQGNAVWEANSLLSSLKVQQTQLEDARTALQSVQQLSAEVTQEADRARLGLSQMKAITNLHDRIIQEQPSVEIAGRVLDDMTLINERLTAGTETTIAASRALDQIIDLEDDLCAQSTRLIEAQEAARQMIGLTEEIRAGMAGFNDALFGLHGLTMLKDTLLEGAQQMEIAQIIGDQLLVMQQRLAEEGTTSEMAMNRAQQLLELNATLTRNDLDLQASKANLEALLQMQQTLGQLPSLTALMESLDVMVSFQEELTDQIQFLSQMRKNLVEIGLMEPTLAKAVRALQPLLELGNVRRMSDEEIRNAARHILDERTTRLSGRSIEDRREIDAKNSVDTVIPNPTIEE